MFNIYLAADTLKWQFVYAYSWPREYKNATHTIKYARRQLRCVCTYLFHRKIRCSNEWRRSEVFMSNVASMKSIYQVPFTIQCEWWAGGCGAKKRIFKLTNEKN